MARLYVIWTVWMQKQAMRRLETLAHHTHIRYCGCSSPCGPPDGGRTRNNISSHVWSYRNLSWNGKTNLPDLQISAFRSHHGNMWRRSSLGSASDCPRGAALQQADFKARHTFNQRSSGQCPHCNKCKIIKATWLREVEKKTISRNDGPGDDCKAAMRWKKGGSSEKSLE